MISHNHKFIFIHIPKCGGSSVIQNEYRWHRPISKYRGNHDRPHEPLEFYKKTFPKEFKEYFKFSIVRNPWAKDVSLFFFRKMRSSFRLDGQPTASPHWPSAELIAKTSFRDTVLNSLNQNPEFSEIVPPRDSNETAWLEPACFPWITLDGKIGLDFICKLETIQQDYSKACDKIGIPRQKFPHTNRTNHKHYTKHYTEYYDDETREIIGEKYAKDIEHFGYEFGG